MKQFPNTLTLMLDEQADGNGYVYTVWESAEEAQKFADGISGVITPLTITEESKGRQATPEIGTEDEPDCYYYADYDSALGKVAIFFDGRSFHAFPLDEFPVWECDMDKL